MTFGNSPSNEQYELATELAIKEGLDVKVLLSDYRQIDGNFDAVYSVAMYEAVGHKHWNDFFEKVAGIIKHYSLTLRHWEQNLRQRKSEVLKLYSSEKEANWFYRLWELYLAGCAASFAVRGGMDLHQFIFSQDNTNWDIAKLKL